MQRTIVFENSTALATTLSWKATSDLDIIDFYGLGAAAVLSFRPDLTYAAVSAPSVTAVLDENILICSITLIHYSGLIFPVLKDQLIYLATSAAKNVWSIVVDDRQPLSAE